MINQKQDKLVVAFQGMPGAYSNIACEAYFNEITTLPCNSFEDMLNNTKNGISDYAMVPVENSLAGRVADIHHLIPESGLFIIGEHFQRGNHQLLGLPNTKIEDLKSVKSHAQGLAQCRKFLNKFNLTPLQHIDTAGAAEEIVGNKRLALVFKPGTISEVEKSFIFWQSSSKAGSFDGNKRKARSAKSFHSFIKITLAAILNFLIPT